MFPGFSGISLCLREMYVYPSRMADISGILLVKYVLLLIYVMILFSTTQLSREKERLPRVFNKITKPRYIEYIHRKFV